MKLKQVLIIALILFGIACNKENSSEIPGNNNPRISEVASGQEYLRLQYNSNGKVIKAFMKDDDATNGDEITFNISYNADGSIQQVDKSDGETIKAVYDQGKLVRADLYAGNDLIGATTYEFLNGFITSAELKSKLGNIDIPVLKFIFEYDANGNIAKTNLLAYNPITTQLENTGYVQATFDNKPNPLADIKQFMWLILQAPSKNNPLSELQYDEQGLLDQTTLYQYTYGSGGLPTKADLTLKAPGQADGTQTILFTYQ